MPTTTGLFKYRRSVYIPIQNCNRSENISVGMFIKSITVFDIISCFADVTLGNIRRHFISKRVVFGSETDKISQTLFRLQLS